MVLYNRSSGVIRWVGRDAFRKTGLIPCQTPFLGSKEVSPNITRRDRIWVFFEIFSILDIFGYFPGKMGIFAGKNGKEHIEEKFRLFFGGGPNKEGLYLSMLMPKSSVDYIFLTLWGTWLGEGVCSSIRGDSSLWLEPGHFEGAQIASGARRGQNGRF